MTGLEFFSLLKMPAEMSKNSSNQELLICKNIDSDVSYFEVCEFNKKRNNWNILKTKIIFPWNEKMIHCKLN